MTSLTGTLPELQAAYDALDQYAQSIGVGIDVADFGGLRTKAQTDDILQYRVDDFDAARRAGQIRPDTTLQQFRPIAPFGQSYHNYGAAFDITVRARPSSLSVAAVQRKLGDYAPRVGLRWGGTFTNPDPPHFELAIPLAEAQARYRAASAGGGVLDALPFDLSSFIPGLTPSVEPTLELPDVYGGAADDSGVTYTTEAPPVNTWVLIAFVGGVMVWALRRKFAPN